MLAACTALACSAAPPTPAYVGSASCAGCHSAEAERWRGTHHARAMAVADERSVLGDFDDVSFEHFGVVSRFARRDGRYLVHTEGPSGQLADFEIAYTLGVEPLQQYLVRFPDGRLQALGLAWDSRPRDSGGQRWMHLYPDERLQPGDPLHWTGRAQTANAMCVECHVTGFRKGYDAASNRYATGWSEPNVACEACHGPGSAHATWARARDGSPDPGLPVALREPGGWRRTAGERVARRDPPRAAHVELETCAPCHSRRSSLFLEPPRGQPLLDDHRLALLDPGLYFADGQQQDEVYEYGSFLESRMYAAGVTCSDCHEPHALALRAQGNALCVRCHDPERYDASAHHHHRAGSAGSACVECHMPARTYMRVDARRDHGLRVPHPDLSQALGVPNPCSGCHAQGDRFARDAIEKWRGAPATGQRAFAAALDAGRRAAADAPERLLALVDNPNVPGIARATALEMLAAYVDASRVPVLERAAQDPDPLVRHAVATAAAELPPAARVELLAPLLRDPVRGVRIESAAALASLLPSLASADVRAALEPALTEYRDALLEHEDRPESGLNLGVLELALGQREQARASYERAIRVGPDFIPAYVNLADLHREGGRDDDAERVLEAGLSRAPDQPDLLHALGLLRVRQQRLPDAIAPLRRAAPARSRYAYVYAMALDASGRSAEALEVLENSHRERPADREPLLGLASLHAQHGDRAAALANAEALLRLRPADPEALALIAALRAASE